MRVALGLVLFACLAEAGYFAFTQSQREPTFMRVALPDKARIHPAATPEPTQSPLPAAEEESPAPSPPPEVLEAMQQAETQAPTRHVQPVPSDAALYTNFDLASVGSSREPVAGDEVVVRKVLRIGEKEIGSAPIHVDKGSRLLIDVADLQRLFRSAGVASALNGQNSSSALASFGDLRRDGVDLRYDPVTDTIAVTVG